MTMGIPGATKPPISSDNAEIGDFLDLRPRILLVDDQPARLLTYEAMLAGLKVRCVRTLSGDEALEQLLKLDFAAVLLDVYMPGLDGFEVARLIRGHPRLERTPIIFVTGHGDIPMSVRAMKAGAAEFLTKPFREQELLEAIQRAIDKDGITKQHSAELRALQERYALLTPREREVFPRVTSGLLNKQIGAELGASEKTIKVHRGQVMQKMKAESLADLIHMAKILGLTSN